ncbi:MAG: DUF2235 domain-containing protein [Burkholderiaceae bacterium]
MRNIAVFCDGTNNLWGEGRDTNVVKLARLSLADHKQIVYYDPGVGSNDGLPLNDPIESLIYRFQRVLGFALARGIYGQIAEAYLFICTNFQPGDRIFLFGFSRGAFAARSVGGLINMFGLVPVSMTSLIPSMVQAYFSNPQRRRKGPSRDEIAADIRASFVPASRLPTVHFVGVWDTVESVGIASNLQISNNTSISGKRFAHVRHAVSLHECRQDYRPRLYAEQCDPHQTIEQRWFAGVHSDVGGSYAEAGLSNCALQWIARAAIRAGLRVDTRRLRECRGDPLAPAHDQTFDQPIWSLIGLAERDAPARHAVHPSALHRERTFAGLENPEASTIWKAIWRRRGFWGVMGLAGLFLLGIGLYESVLCARLEGGLSCNAYRLVAGLTGQWGDGFRALLERTDASNLGYMLAADTLFIPAFLVLLAYLSTHAQRRLYAWADTARRRRRVAQVGMLPLWYCPGFDLLENMSLLAWLATPGQASWLTDVLVWLVPWFGLAKFASLALLLGLVLASWVVGKPVSTSRIG